MFTVDVKQQYNTIQWGLLLQENQCFIQKALFLVKSDGKMGRFIRLLKNKSELVFLLLNINFILKNKAYYLKF